MKLKDFLGKVVMGKDSKKRYVLTKIDGVFISAREEAPNKLGTYTSFRWATGTTPGSNAITNGTLVFEDTALKDAFTKVYEEYFYTDGRHDQYFYYMAKCD